MSLYDFNAMLKLDTVKFATNKRERGERTVRDEIETQNYCFPPCKHSTAARCCAKFEITSQFSLASRKEDDELRRRTKGRAMTKLCILLAKHFLRVLSTYNSIPPSDSLQLIVEIYVRRAHQLKHEAYFCIHNWLRPETV